MIVPLLDDDTIPLPPLDPPAVRHRAPAVSGTTVAGVLALLLLALGGLLAGMAVVAVRQGHAPAMADVPDAPSAASSTLDAPGGPPDSASTPDVGVIAGPPAPQPPAAPSTPRVVPSPGPQSAVDLPRSVVVHLPELPHRKHRKAAHPDR